MPIHLRNRIKCIKKKFVLKKGKPQIPLPRNNTPLGMSFQIPFSAHTQLEGRAGQQGKNNFIRISISCLQFWNQKPHLISLG